MRQDGAGLSIVVLDRGMLKSRGLRSRLTSAARPVCDGASAHESYALPFCLTLVPGRVPVRHDTPAESATSAGSNTSVSIDRDGRSDIPRRGIATARTRASTVMPSDKVQVFTPE